MLRSRHWTEWLVVAIAVITILSGAVQFIVPGVALGAMSLEASNASVFLFRFLSVVTALFGAALLHTAWDKAYIPAVLLWAGLQKLAGTTLIVAAAVSGVVAVGALPVAIYDGLAGLYVLGFVYRRRG
ncbi:MAG: hypothetical protein IT298_06405 [Chloroflexi bacterium]|jgi:hypothetical protein|nr:MAG: hypothetical protein UZ13_01390 [Chloroflexi bacterium OLB13]MBC6955874.1 hypothetical protein [Chloroflexota bacterium]MBV6436577.1 hypothetical protein [Anaerolineae bacterium]MDL1915446.1 hypothetical protein [Anaerolineae bacterium CFX4]OQY81609.1 MAG: hypothetical protein B6D42_10930 [Anaerolineae bacterium UTCFX5]